ncbi:extracellular solute-binding protein [Paenibacillus agaridevorans]|uniref:extracellular solute-binding protein n=1 Tax=Paenibacillus agaridevorans TaxID=171404 RepID=UPI001BE4A513|nr:extracellular solute-binding protein [Paenibacillus agaridevorans]
MTLGRGLTKIAGWAVLLALAVTLASCRSGEYEYQNYGIDAFETASLESLTYYTFLNTKTAASLKNLGEHEAYKKKKEWTGVDVYFIHPEHDYSFQLLLTSHDLPDIIEAGWITLPGGPEKYLSDGKIIRLNEYLDQYAPNFSKLLNEHPEYRKLISTDDGSIYAFPFLRGDPFLQTFRGLAIRKDWLDNLSMNIPETIDEWHAVLKAFKEQDPNRNGKADEIPLSIRWEDLGFLSAWGIKRDFYQVDGEVKYGLIEPEFRQYIATLKLWYDEGLIDPEFMVTDNRLRAVKLTADTLGSQYSYTIGRENESMKGIHPTFEMIAAPNPVLNKGDKPLIGQQDPMYTGYGAAITTSADDIPGLVRWMDFNYGEEGGLLFNFGIEGESYTMMDGYPTFKQTIWEDAAELDRYILSSSYGPFVQDKRWMEQKADRLKNGRNSLETWMNADNNRHLPPLSPNEKERSELDTIMSDINLYAAEALNKFILGVEPLDHYDQFLITLKQMGIERAIAIQQAALDRFHNR